MEFRQAYTAVHVMETAENFGRADAPLTSVAGDEDRFSSNVGAYDAPYDDDGSFWARMFSDPSAEWGRHFNFSGAILSEWVPRVPGLYWRPASQRLRKVDPAKIEKKSAGWVQYEPTGKSQKVSGGIGTFRLPPSPDGMRLIALTTTCNASAGVPALVKWNVFEKIRRKGRLEGRLVSGRGRWEGMSDGWASRFEATRNIPRGYIVLDEPDQIWDVSSSLAPTEFHPFTIMEYHDGSKLLFDFVYATADTGDDDYRSGLENFFDSYKRERGRQGRYLLPGDMLSPMWDARFANPTELRQNSLLISQLDLLEQRVREHMIGKNTIERTMEALAFVCTNTDDLLRLSSELNVSQAFWNIDGTLAAKIGQFVAQVAGMGRLEALVEAVAIQYPQLLQ